MSTIYQLRKSLGTALCMLMFLTLETQAQTKEYQVKAAFLFNFAQFVEWPDTTFTNADAPFCIGILGDDPFGKALDQTIQDETINGHKIAIQRSKHLADLMHCQMIFVSKSEKSYLADIFTALDSHPVLTVGELPNFARSGGGINFIQEGSKVRFELNPGAVQRDGLKFSSQLLSLGRIVLTAKEVK